MDFEEAREALTEMADSLPSEIFRELNGGIILVPDAQRDAHGLFIMGRYHFDPRGLGRYITIYHGSFMELYAYSPHEVFREKLREVLHHELVHHIEHLAGDKSLEVQDEIDKARMLGF